MRVYLGTGQSWNCNINGRHARELEYGAANPAFAGGFLHHVPAASVSIRTER
jgi:hypothetical protein